MTPRATRTAIRAIHVALGLCVGAVVYAPATWIDPLRGALGAVVVPLLVVTGVTLWQQARLRRLVSSLARRPRTGAAAE
ncbi:hypothetical protein [Myceligenerans pegani]|uniref:Uncharacterized protein n=1 Tax=Myceligenerans pegani TaxID=2776917 RepID=A0ABR9N4Y5_9MICO|nr:hypothetical protein [Myceligenerans sp. TRM 65318]MBE1878336.1 hypothetical protein [Myceligenerans sp. TRM 65318]MBE3020607.1 hypothetical protein [Myceligenerans sp. TRM 65318]